MRGHGWQLTCSALGLRHIRTKPERLIQTSLREWAYAQPTPPRSARRVALADWLRHYNTVRVSTDR